MSETEPTTTAPKRTRKPRTNKVAETAPVDNVVIQEQAVGEVDTNVISSPEKPHTDGPVKSNNSVSAAGVIGSVAADRVFEKQPEKVVSNEPEKVALWSDKNIRWSSFGTLAKGYNIVKKEAAESWLTRGGVRVATPEEVAAHYGK